jgi:hypothetical protein
MKSIASLMFLLFLFFGLMLTAQETKPKKQSGARLIESIIIHSGIDSARLKFQEIKADTINYSLTQREFNAAGYRLIDFGKLDEAVVVFKMNIDLFPESANSYDSMGEAYLFLGDKEKAIDCYKMIKTLDPGNDNGEIIVKNIRNELEIRRLEIPDKFFAAARSGNFIAVKAWLKNNPSLLNKKSQDGNSALHLAVYGGYADVTEYLLSQGSDLNTRNILGQTPYNLSETGNLDSIKLMLTEKGADKAPQQFPTLKTKYLGQKEPGIKPEIFARGIVSTHSRVYSNICFSPDFTEAMWTRNEINLFQNHGGLIRTVFKRGKWTAPEEIRFLSNEYDHRSPYYSLDGKRLYFQGHMGGKASWDQFERFYYVERKGDEWSQPVLLDTIFNKYANHWQFSLDNNNNLYFGGSLRGKENPDGILYSHFENGKYQEPVLLFSSKQFGEAVFGPAISPGGDYIIFTRIHPRGSANPRIFSIYLSFRNGENAWTEPVELGEKLDMDANQPRISPDGKFIFYVGNDGYTYWVSSKIIDALRPGKKK